MDGHMGATLPKDKLLYGAHIMRVCSLEAIWQPRALVVIAAHVIPQHAQQGAALAILYVVKNVLRLGVIVRICPTA